MMPMVWMLQHEAMEQVVHVPAQKQIQRPVVQTIQHVQVPMVLTVQKLVDGPQIKCLDQAVHLPT